MGQSLEYKSKYQKAKIEYLEGKESLTTIAKKYGIDRGTFSNNLKKDGIEIINKQNITKFDETFFDIIDTEEKAYWLGFLYADGAISSSSNGIEVSLKSSDIGHLKKLVKSLKFQEEKHLFQDDVRCRFEISNKHMKQKLINLGCTPRKSLTLTFPNEKQLPNNLLFHFIRGYVDGDGSVMLGTNHKKEYVKPRLSILGTESFLKTLIDRTCWNQVKIQSHSGTHCVEWGGKYVFKYLQQLYEGSSIYLDRKYNKFLEIKTVFCRSQE